MALFNAFFQGNPFSRQMDQSGSLPSHLIHILLVVGMFFFGMGVLVLIFPLILAVFVASIFFVFTAGCLFWAWKVFLIKRRQGKQAEHIEVTIIEPDDN